MNITRAIIKKTAPFMKSKGFLCTEKTYYCIHDDIAYCISVDAPGGLLYVTAYVMPLYIPCEGRYYTYGNRLNSMKGIALPLLKKNTDIRMIDEWCEQLCRCIETYIIPFFERICTPEKLLDYVGKSPCSSDMHISCHEVYIYRLKLFTYMYLRDFSKVTKVAKTYRTILSQITFLTAEVCKKYMDEIEQIECFIQEDIDSVNSFCAHVIQDVKKEFFP